MWLTIDASAYRAQLIKGEFGVGHWFVGVVEVIPPMHTPSPESMAEVMTGIKQYCDLDHRRSQAIKNPARGGAKQKHIDDYILIGYLECEVDSKLDSKQFKPI